MLEILHVMLYEAEPAGTSGAITGSCKIDGVMSRGLLIDSCCFVAFELIVGS